MCYTKMKLVASLRDVAEHAGVSVATRPAWSAASVNALRSLIDDPQKPLPDYSFRPRLNIRGSTAPPP
jgi:hypothetical protein